MRLLSRLHFLANMWLPFGLVSLIKEVRQVVGDNATFESINGVLGKLFLWSSMAFCFNYISGGHMDVDAFLGVITVAVYSDEGVKKYDIDDEIALYFCLPAKGICIGMRPGDVIFFNPKEYHCISQRTSAYKEDQVFVTSCYYKARQLGGNNNDIDDVQEVDKFVDNDDYTIAIDNLCIHDETNDLLL